MEENTPVLIDKMEGFRAGRIALMESLQGRQDALDAAVATGDARRLQDGSYKFIRGLDKGETLTAQGMPQHELDMLQNGKAALYSTNARPWWGVGTHFEQGLFSTEAALKASGCDWELGKVRSRYVMVEGPDGSAEISEDNPILLGQDDQFQAVRKDTRVSLGQVGKIWTPIQNLAGFKWMEEFGEPFETMGSFRGGRKVFATMRMPHTMRVDAGGIDETIQMYIAAVNHHNGNGGLNLYVTPYRIECGNTERLGIANAVTRWVIQHTPNYEAMLLEARRSLKLIDRYTEAWQRDENKLAQRDITDAEIAQVIADVWDIKDDTKVRKLNNQAQRVLDIMNRWEIERDRCGRTAYGLERALTGHADHTRDDRPRDADMKGMTPLDLLGVAILEDSESLRDLKNKIHRRTMALVNTRK